MLRILLLAALMLVGPLAVAQESSGILAQGDNPLSIPAITLTYEDLAGGALHLEHCVAELLEHPIRKH